MPNKLSVFNATAYPTVALPVFGAPSLAASQAQVALKLMPNDATSGTLNITGIPMPLGGSIIAITATLGSNLSAGTFGISPTVGGTEVSSTSPLYRVSIASSSSSGYATADADSAGLTFTAGQLVGAKATTNGSFACSGSADLLVVIYVIFNNWTP